MAKRSPILGYNHNVRYRGVVFHVQTEDSGLLNPHLFTHLFHGGVIVSTRKLVYDAGSNEEAVKALMQAQHKAVMKDLRKGAFDEKIDQYLAGTPGLEPRAGSDPKQKLPRGERAQTEADPETARAALDKDASPVEIVNEGLSEPIELPIKKPSGGVPVQARADTGDRTIPVDVMPPPPGEEDAPTDISHLGGSPAKSRTTTAQKVSKTKAADIARAPTQLATKPPPGAESHEPRDSAPIIEIDIDDDERSREPRDTAVEEALGIAAPHRHTRPPSHGAAALPAMKPPSRPISPPIVTRQPTQERKRKDSDVVEVYSPPPPSVEPPPGERAERPGQYSMSRREGAVPIREKTGRLAAIAPSTSSPPAGRSRSNPGTGPSPAVPVPGARSNAPAARQGASQPPPIPQAARSATPVAGSRVPTPQPAGRVHVTAPISNRAPSPASGSGVVMSRPAVIVGAPPKPPQTPRVRKAREDEGRGFGQGLISEKSLDEVILAYLSEDAEDK